MSVDADDCAGCAIRSAHGRRRDQAGWQRASEADLRPCRELRLRLARRGGIGDLGFRFFALVRIRAAHRHDRLGVLHDLAERLGQHLECALGRDVQLHVVQRRADPRQLARTRVELVPEHRPEHGRELAGFDRRGFGNRFFELLAKRPRRIGSACRVARERFEHDAIDAERNVAERTRRRHVAFHDALDHLRVGLAMEEPSHGEHLPEHDAERIDVDASVDLAAGELLGGHVSELAFEPGAGVGHVEAVSGLRDAEVDDLHLAARAEQDVLRADVAVDHLQELTGVVAGLVGGMQAGSGPHDEGSRRLGLQPTTHLRQRHQELGQRRAVHVLHHQEVAAVGALPQLLDGHDVRVRDASCDSRLVDEHLDELLVVGEVVLQHLDRHVSLETGRPRALTQVERGHSAALQLGEHFVSSELGRGLAHAIPTVSRPNRGSRDSPWGSRYFLPSFFAILAQLSRSAIVRLSTNAPGAESRSTTK